MNRNSTFRQRATTSLGAALVMVMFTAGCDKSTAEPAPSAAKAPGSESASPPPTPAAPRKGEATVPSNDAGEAKPGAGEADASATKGPVEDASNTPSTVYLSPIPSEVPVAESWKPVKPAVADGVYVVTRNSVAQIANGKWKRFAKFRGNMLPRKAQLGADGKLWVLGESDVANTDAKGRVKELKLKDNGALSGLVVFPDGTAYVSGVYGVSYYDGKGWSTDKSADVGLSGSYRSLFAGADKTVYVTTRRGLAWKTPSSKWQNIPLANELGPVAVGPEGGLWVATGRRLVPWRAGGDDMPAFVGVTDSGCSVYAMRWANKRLFTRCSQSVAMWHGKASTTWKAKDPQGIPLQRVKDLAVGPTGRMWAAGVEGVATAQAPSGEGATASWALHPVGSSKLLSEPPLAIVVVGEGSPFPKIKRAIEGTVVGTLTRKGVPIANATVELCASTTAVFRRNETPCSRNPWVGKAVTDAEGRFTIEGVAKADMKLAYRTSGGRWGIVIGFNCCKRIRDGKVLKLRKIRLY